MDEKPLPCPPVELLDLATAYQRAKTLFAFVEFALPTLLSRQTLPLEEIAHSLNIHEIAADRFLNACVALKLLERADDRFGNTSLSEEFLVQGKPAYLGDHILKYDRSSYQNWADLPRKLRQWQPGTNSYVPPPGDDQCQDISAQHNLSLLLGYALSEAYDFSFHRKMLDVGGGTGGMSIGICKRNRELRAAIFELPSTADMAREFISNSGYASRIEVRAGSFTEDELPGGFDIVLLANLLSMASEDENRKLLRKLYERLPDNGAVILSGWILDDGRTSPLIPVLFCLEDINCQAPDVERSASTYERWLRGAGFVEIERQMYCAPTSMMVGRKRAGAINQFS